jgi:Flp pilus assembly protein TadD
VPFEGDPHLGLARALATSGDATEAIRRYRLALQVGAPDEVVARTELAETLLAAGRRDEAKREVIRALEHAPRFERAQELLLQLVDGQASPPQAEGRWP